MFSLKDKVALVTGASQGIGWDTAQALVVAIHQQEAPAGQRRHVRDRVRQADDSQGAAVGARGQVLESRVKVAAANDQAVRPFRLAIRPSPDGQVEVTHDEDRHLNVSMPEATRLTLF